MKLLLLLLLSVSATAHAFEILEPTEVTLELERFDILRDPYMPEEEYWLYGAALTTGFTLVGDRENKWRLFYEPTLGFRATEEQVREGHLYYEAGGEILHDRGVRIFRRHESRHKMEIGADGRTYPLLDSWVIQLKWKVD